MRITGRLTQMILRFRPVGTPDWFDSFKCGGKCPKHLNTVREPLPRGVHPVLSVGVSVFAVKTLGRARPRALKSAVLVVPLLQGAVTRQLRLGIAD
jgi:hypothetical protein